MQGSNWSHFKMLEIITGWMFEGIFFFFCTLCLLAKHAEQLNENAPSLQIFQLGSVTLLSASARQWQCNHVPTSVFLKSVLEEIIRLTSERRWVSFDESIDGRKQNAALREIDDASWHFHTCRERSEWLVTRLLLYKKTEQWTAAWKHRQACLGKEVSSHACALSVPLTFLFPPLLDLSFLFCVVLPAATRYLSQYFYLLPWQELT